jgi:hypothetical protein
LHNTLTRVGPERKDSSCRIRVVGRATREGFDKRRATAGSRRPGGEELYMVGSIIFTVGNLVPALLTGITIFGVITGIIAIIFASQVNSRLLSGNWTDAGDAARVAKVLYWITLAIFVVGWSSFAS